MHGDSFLFLSVQSHHEVDYGLDWNLGGFDYTGVDVSTSMEQVASSDQVVYDEYTHQSIDDRSSPQKVAKDDQYKYKQIDTRVLVDEWCFFIFENLP